MKFGGLILIILFILFMKYQYPDVYDAGRETAVDVYDDFTNQSGKVIGRPYMEFDCSDDIDCEVFENKNAFCNVTDGACYYV